MTNKTKISEIQTLKKLIPYLWQNNILKLRINLIISIICLIFSKISNVYVPIYLKKSVDTLSLKIEFIFIPIISIILYAILRLISQFFSDLKDVLFSKIEHHAIRSIAIDTFSHLHFLSLKFHLQRKTGKLSRSIERGTNSIERLLKFFVFLILPAFLEIILVTCLLSLFYNFIFSLLILIILLNYIILTIFITQWRLQLVRFMNKIDGESNNKVIDSIINYETIKYFNNELYEVKQYNHYLLLYEQSAIKSKWSLSILNITQSIIITFGLIILMSISAQLILNKNLTIGDFILINMYVIQLYLPLNNLGFAYREIKIALVNMEELFSIIKEKKETEKNLNNTIKIKNIKINFKNVSFHYNFKRPILRSINFQVPAGKTIAIVGESGSGKSTISRLLFRFYDVITGTITIDNKNIINYNQNSLRKLISIVPQETILFNNTIGYNISYANPTASQEQINSVAKLSKIHNFILNLPNKYNTLVGERGLKLSGGEKQRIAIARAILKNPKIFIFDEATSALDTNTEKYIQKNITHISHNHTTIIISHRLSTIVDADKILVLNKGIIIEEGTHKTLIKEKGFYFQMWQKQINQNFKNQIK